MRGALKRRQQGDGMRNANKRSKRLKAIADQLWRQLDLAARYEKQDKETILKALVLAYELGKKSSC